MKCKNKLKMLSQRWWSILTCALVIFTKTGLAQPYRPQHVHGYRQNEIGGDPYRQYSYQFLPSLPSYGSAASLIGGGRIVEAVKAHPLHYSMMLGGAPTYHAAASPPFQAVSASQPPISSYYSGNYYGGDKRGHYKSYPSYTGVYNSAPTYQTSYPTGATVAASPPSSVYSSIARPSSPPSSSYVRLRPSRYPAEVTSASMDTYREALNLFSEVVRKLERETVPGFGTYSPVYSQSSPAYNDVPGSSYSPAAAGFPPLDQIMGPDFLERAHKLYNKIIKEQNYNRRPSSPEYQTGSTFSASRGHPGNGLSYLERAISPGGKTRTSPYDHTRSSSSPYARNMIVDEETPEKSVGDTVRALEVNISIDKPTERDDDDSMDTSESRFVPHQNTYALPPTNHYFRDQNFGKGSPVAPSPSPSEELSTTSLPTQAPTVPPVYNSIPLNENDFVEHPMPYNEYEELIKEIAVNY